jgi:hypothetical protein
MGRWVHTSKTSVESGKETQSQGDTISPLLFDFIVDVLAAILDAASSARHVQGVVPHPVPEGVTHLQYANDTIMLFQNEPNSIINVKFLLLSFELLSGLKINFLKWPMLLTVR